MLSAIVNVHSAVLAAGPDTSSFTNGPLWGMIQTLGRVAGVLLVLFAIVKVGGMLLGGKHAGAGKIVAGTVIAAVFLFNLDLLFTFLGGMTGLATAIIEAITGIFSSKP